MAALFTAFPATLVTCVAGLALLGTIGSSLHTALQHDDTREAALLTFITTASGINLLGIAAACSLASSCIKSTNGETDLTIW